MMVEHRAFSESVMAERIRQVSPTAMCLQIPMSRCSLLTSARWRADLRSGARRRIARETNGNRPFGYARLAAGQGGETIKVGEIKGRARYDANCRATIVLIWLRSWIGEAYRAVAGAWYIRKG